MVAVESRVRDVWDNEGRLNVRLTQILVRGQHRVGLIVVVNVHMVVASSGGIVALGGCDPIAGTITASPGPVDMNAGNVLKPLSRPLGLQIVWGSLGVTHISPP